VPVNDNAALANLHGYYRWHAHFYDATRWAFLFGRAALIRQAAEQLRPRRILEVGCGTGTNLAKLARRFPDAEIVGLDLSAEMLRKARKKVERYGPRVSLLERVYNAPVSGGDRFDLIVFSYCLSMINPGYAEVLRLSEQDLSPRAASRWSIFTTRASPGSAVGWV
jgi:S-adenosylmethionine-diacylgycerolhomoserine-N-methlytransferase